MGQVLIIVGEDAALVERLTGALTADGHVVRHARSLASARLSIRAEHHELIVVDRELPDGDGLSLCDELRRVDAPGMLLVLASRGTAAERIECLRAGADECMQRPLDVEEIRARISALFRLVRRAEAQHAEPHRPADRIELTPRECSLLACLVERACEPITPAALLSRKWPLTFDPRAGELTVEPSLTRHTSDVFSRVNAIRKTGSR